MAALHLDVSVPLVKGALKNPRHCPEYLAFGLGSVDSVVVAGYASFEKSGDVARLNRPGRPGFSETVGSDGCHCPLALGSDAVAACGDFAPCLQVTLAIRHLP